MIPTSVIALFCEDIRDEVGGSHTLVGVIGDNAIAPPAPPDLPERAKGKVLGIIPRLAIYIRINIDVRAEIIGPIQLKLTMPDGVVVDVGLISRDTIAEAKATAKKGNPMGGIVSRLVFGGLPLTKLGRMTVEAVIDGEPHLAGFLNVMSEEDAAT